ncbi:MAG TPA: hypothetical protein VIM55_01055 [Mucilaginibacter sp.]
MKKLTFLLLILPAMLKAQEVNYMAKADSCMKLKDYACAATNYQTYMNKVDTESNGLAYMVARAWGMAGDKNKTLAALEVYKKNNALNNNPFFSKQLLKEKAFDFLKDDPKWQLMISSVQKSENELLARERAEAGYARLNWKNFEREMNVRPQLNGLTTSGDLYAKLKTKLAYQSPRSYLKDSGIVMYIHVDTTEVPFYVHIPVDYDPAKPSPALVVLHGAVRVSSGYAPAGALPHIYNITSPHIPGYTKKYITIYPLGTKWINWMTTESGFDMVNRIVIHLKALLNIDDNRVELIGHSNGATGVFTYLVKAPTLYAGFYGMNTQPKVYIGGTFLQNGMGRHFYNFATDKDYYYPPQAVKIIDSIANSLGVNWHTQLNKGYPHWFPAMKESQLPMSDIFEDMATRVRNPYPQKIYFETDNLKYNTSDWITITVLDTLSTKAAWQIDPNFKITEWLDNQDFNKVICREEMAFDYPHRSGAVKAHRTGNDIYVETSNVSAFSIKLNRDMIDYRRKVNVYVNRQLKFSKKIRPDKQFTLNNFKAELDRSAIWENELKFEVR